MRPLPAVKYANASAPSTLAVHTWLDREKYRNGCNGTEDVLPIRKKKTPRFVVSGSHFLEIADTFHYLSQHSHSMEKGNNEEMLTIFEDVVHDIRA